jgi:transposase
MLTVGDLMTRFGVGERTVLTWLSTRQLKGIDVSRNARARRPSWRFREEDVLAFERERMSAPPAPAPTRRKTQPAASVPDFCAGM